MTDQLQQARPPELEKIAEDRVPFYRPQTQAVARYALALEAQLEQAQQERDEYADHTRDHHIARVRAERKAEAYREALGEDAAGRPFSELLDVTAQILRDAGGGPVVDCLEAKAEQVRCALSSETPAQEQQTWQGDPPSASNHLRLQDRPTQVPSETPEEPA